MPSLGFQWNLTKVDLPSALTSRKVMDAEALHHPQRARDRAVGHRPHQHVGGFRHQRCPVPERVVRAAGLRIAAIGLHLHRVDQVGKLDRVLDEEDRNVVADQIPIALLGIELHGEAAHVARRVDRAGAARDGRKAREHRVFSPGRWNRSAFVMSDSDS